MATPKTESKAPASGENAGPGATEAPRPGEPPSATRRARRCAPSEPRRAPLNVIRPAEVLRKATAPQSPRRPRAPAPDTARKAGDNAIRPPLDTETVPSHVRERYAQDGRQYYLRSGERAFVDHGARLTTGSENTTIVRDLVAVAAARGWSEIVVGGTKAFRREAWREGKLAGLEVVGYKPTRAEQALLIDALTRRSDGPRAEERASSAPAASARGAEAPEESPLIVGRLVAHGPGRDSNDPEQPASYYVLLKTPRGEREVWGPDLERAIRQSLTDVQIGDEIGLRAVERRATLPKRRSAEGPTPEPDARGEAPRDGWIVEQRRFFNDRAALAKVFRDPDIRPSDGYRKHPELKGSYLELQAAKLRFEHSVKNPQDRAAFLTQLRERMAAAMERGEPLMPVRLRERPATREAQSPEQVTSIPDPRQLLVR